MSVVFTGTNQGRFISTGAAVTLPIRSDVDWMYIVNETVSYAAGNNDASEFYWQRGMTQGRGIQYIKTVVTDALAPNQIAANAGFFLVDTTVNVPGASVALTGITAGNPPVVNTANTAGLSPLDIVRIFNTVGARQLGSLDFTIDNIVPNTSFELAYMAAIVNANPGAGTFRKIPYNPYFYPRNRTITKISNAQDAIVTLSVDHQFTIGQVVRFVIPTVTALAFGMTELNDVQATIVAIGDPDVDGITNTITINVDTTGANAFAFPLTANVPFTSAQVVPVGENTAVALASNVNLLGDSEQNQGIIGMQLAFGANSPAGAANDVIYWVAGKSYSIDNN